MIMIVNQINCESPTLSMFLHRMSLVDSCMFKFKDEWSDRDSWNIVRDLTNN